MDTNPVPTERVCKQDTLVGKDERASNWDTSAQLGVVTDRLGLPVAIQLVI
jgi:hypothetical protein